MESERWTESRVSESAGRRREEQSPLPLIPYLKRAQRPAKKKRKRDWEGREEIREEH